MVRPYELPDPVVDLPENNRNPTAAKVAKSSCGVPVATAGTWGTADATTAAVVGTTPEDIVGTLPEPVLPADD